MKEKPTPIQKDVDCINFTPMFSYLDEKGVDVAPICAKINMSREDLTKPGNMLSLPDALTVIREVKAALNEPDPRILYFIGRESTRLGSLGTLIDIGRKMGNTEKSVRFIPRFNRKFNDIFEMTAYDVTRDAGIVLVQYKDKPGYDTVWILDQDHWNEGIIAGIPLAWGPPYMSTETVLSRFTIEALFRAYAYRGYKLEKRGHRYLVEGSEIAMDVALETEEVERSRDMLQIVGQTDKHRILTNTGAMDIDKVPVTERDRLPRGVMFTRDFPISDLWTIKENTVFGAPYSRINLKWQARRDLRTVVGEFILGEREGDKKLLEALENELTASKEKTYEIERLYWNLKGQFARERKLERIMTGGFAHEERNALTGAIYQFQDIMDFEGGKTALELIRQESAAVLKTVLAMQEDSGIPRHVIEQEIIPRFRRQSDTLKAMERKLENVGEGIRRALEITERIRAYSRMQDFQRGDERVDLEELLIQYKEIYGQRISESQITYTVTCLTDDPSITGSASQMDTVLRNLVLNALDAVEEEEGKARMVEAILSREEKSGVAYLRIHVKDTGPGIPAEKVDEVFDPFYSTKPTTGTGLGLSEARRMVELYGGEISVNSTPGQGAAFTVLLPQ